MRIPRSEREGTVSGYFDNLEALAKALAVPNGHYPALYVTLNPVNPSLLARAANRIRQRVKKYADCSPAFEVVARRREAKAVAAEAANELVTARENYFMAAIHWGAAQWPIDQNNEQNLGYNKKKRDCFTSYARLADHRVEPVWIPLGGKALPAWFHLPPGYAGGRIPVVVFVPGMDSFKEASVWMYGDPYLSRGFAVLAMEGPGQYECPTLGIYMSMEGWEQTGKACMDWLVQQNTASGELQGKLDTTREVTIGYSWGGGAAIDTADRPNVKATFSLHGMPPREADAWTKMHAPLMLIPAQIARYEQTIDSVRAQLGDEVFAAARATGRAMSPAEAMGDAMPESTHPLADP